MSERPEEHAASSRSRLHRFLSNPIGWLVFLVAEMAVLFGLIMLLPLERYSAGTATAAKLAILVAAVIVNYRIRRLYLSDWWQKPER